MGLATDAERMTQRFLWSILGTGLVAHKFVVDLRQVEGAEVVAVASRDPDNARRFATGHGIPNALDYDNAIKAQADAARKASEEARNFTNPRPWRPSPPERLF